MPQQDPTIHDAAAPAHSTAVQARETVAYEPIEDQDERLDELDELAELPRRPRRRLLAPIPLALLGVFLVASGFIGGVLVEKGQTSTSSGSSAGAGASLASRFAALRGGASRTGARAGTPSSGGASGELPGSGGGGLVAGQVAYLSGSTLYVTNAEGNTVKVTASAGTSVSKTVKMSVKGIHPGEMVTVTGATGKYGAVSAESIRVGSGGGGLAALLGGSSSSSSSGSGTRGGGGGGGESGGPALFGNGG